MKHPNLIINPMDIDNEVSEEDIEELRELLKVEYMRVVNRVIAAFGKNAKITYRKLNRIRKQAAFKLLNEVTNDK